LHWGTGLEPARFHHAYVGVATALWPLVARAADSAKRRIGVLTPFSLDDAEGNAIHLGPAAIEVDGRAKVRIDYRDNTRRSLRTAHCFVND
jgi:hypothetical protein